MKVLICVNLKNSCLSSFKSFFEKSGWDNINEVHFIHGFEMHIYADNFLVTRYPMKDDVDAIRTSVVTALEDISDELVKSDRVKVFHHCIVSENIKSDIVDYADENRIDEIVAVTHKKGLLEGIFSSSFAEYLVRHAHCAVTILRD